MLAAIDIMRKEATHQLDQSQRSSLGQFMTPAVIAQFMAAMFLPLPGKKINLLDAGAGIGSLTVSFLERLTHESPNQSISYTGYEVDSTLFNYLSENIQAIKKQFSQNGLELNEKLVCKDFIEHIVPLYRMGHNLGFTHAILNPPYKKINTASRHRKLLGIVGIETVNLYSAFISLAIKLLQDKGELVAIIPRSFCNGTYYKPFRTLIDEETVIKRIHLFDSRNQAFKDDNVLQENIIIHLVKGAPKDQVVVSRSANETFDDLIVEVYDYNHIIQPYDPEKFIRIPHPEENPLLSSRNISFTLKDLGLSVSTGPVVEFRVKEFLSQDIKEGYIPLLYPTHFNGTGIEWPKAGKKPNALKLNHATEKMIYPKGCYTVVKRFSSKEEKQRIVARVVEPTKVGFACLGFENHLNVIHSNKSGISEDVAYGLAAYLNSGYVDSYFRTFNGHTQVNANDLRQMKFPSIETLSKLGKWAKSLSCFIPEELNEKIKEYL